MADEPQYNAKCPFCGEESLVATVQAVNDNVPLKPGDYDFDEGDPSDTEILQITCISCKREDIDRTHYFNHGPDGDPCDCNEPIPVHLDAEEER